MLNFVMLSVEKLSVVMLSLLMLIVVTLNVFYAECRVYCLLFTTVLSAKVNTSF
jgi:hypothetical protein